MRQNDFDKMFEESITAMRSLLCSKGADYSDDNDRLSNFKIIADLVGITPLQVWAVYKLKHTIAIMNYVKKGKLESEPIESRFFDENNYGMLGLGLIKEKEDENNV